MFARAGPVRIHRADTRWMGALVVRALVLDGVHGAVNERVQRHALQPHRGHEHQGEDLCPSGEPICAGGNRHGEAVVLFTDSTLHQDVAK